MLSNSAGMGPTIIDTIYTCIALNFHRLYILQKLTDHKTFIYENNGHICHV